MNAAYFEAAANTLKVRRDFMLAVVKIDGTKLGFRKEPWCSDREVVMEAVKQRPEVLVWASLPMRKDRELLKIAVSGQPELFAENDLLARKDPEIFALAIRLSSDVERLYWIMHLHNHHKKRLTSVVKHVLELEKIPNMGLGERLDPEDWEGNALATYARHKWKPRLWEIVGLVTTKLPGGGTVHRAVFEFAGIGEKLRSASQLSKSAPLLASLELKGLVSSWRCFHANPGEIEY